MLSGTPVQHEHAIQLLVCVRIILLSTCSDPCAGPWGSHRTLNLPYKMTYGFGVFLTLFAGDERVQDLITRQMESLPILMSIPALPAANATVAADHCALLI